MSNPVEILLFRYVLSDNGTTDDTQGDIPMYTKLVKSVILRIAGRPTAIGYRQLTKAVTLVYQSGGTEDVYKRQLFSLQLVGYHLFTYMSTLFILCYNIKYI